MIASAAFDANNLLALVIALGFAAGLNVYAVVATLGLLARADVIDLPASIALVDSWSVIGASLALYALEFVADKIPLIDLLWSVLQTLVRVPAAAVLAFATTERLPFELQVMATILGTVAAAAASSGKLAVRGAVTTSPEPFSNMVLSVGEDVVAIGLTWFAMTHPWLAASLAVTGIVIVVLSLRWIARAVRAVFRRARTQAHSRG